MSVVNTARQVGEVIGIALLGTLVAHRATFISGLHMAVVLGGAAFLAGCALTLSAADRRRPATPVTQAADQDPERCR
jgi:DHA2 family methylenomycin A resistance protein-like MFS transporter